MGGRSVTQSRNMYSPLRPDIVAFHNMSKARGRWGTCRKFAAAARAAREDARDAAQRDAFSEAPGVFGFINRHLGDNSKAAEVVRYQTGESPAAWHAKSMGAADGKAQYFAQQGGKPQRQQARAADRRSLVAQQVAVSTLRPSLHCDCVSVRDTCWSRTGIKYIWPLPEEMLLSLQSSSRMDILSAAAEVTSSASSPPTFPTLPVCLRLRLPSSCTAPFALYNGVRTPFPSVLSNATNLSIRVNECLLYLHRMWAGKQQQRCRREGCYAEESSENRAGFWGCCRMPWMRPGNAF